MCLAAVRCNGDGHRLVHRLADQVLNGHAEKTALQLQLLEANNQIVRCAVCRHSGPYRCWTKDKRRLGRVLVGQHTDEEDACDILYSCFLISCIFLYLFATPKCDQ